MKLRHVLGACAVLFLSTALEMKEAFAFPDDSTRGPLYVQGTVPLGLHYWNFPGINGYGFAGWRPDVEFGAHINGRHDGFVFGLRQAFVINISNAFGGGHAGGTTDLKYGYDLPFVLGDYELTVAPYGTFGLGYVFDGPSAGIGMAWGIEGKFFFYEGVYAFARPFEMGFRCLHDIGQCAIEMTFGAGVGFAFPNPK